MGKFIKRYFAALPLVPDCDPTGTATSLPPCGSEQLYQLGSKIIQFLIDTSIAVVILFVIWGGFLMLTSGGSSEQVSRGKKAITSAIIGLVIVLASASIVGLFLHWFTKCELQWWNGTLIFGKDTLICNQ